MVNFHLVIIIQCRIVKVVIPYLALKGRYIPAMGEAHCK